MTAQRKPPRCCEHQDGRRRKRLSSHFRLHHSRNKEVFQVFTIAQLLAAVCLGYTVGSIITALGLWADRRAAGRKGACRRGR